MSGWQYQMWGDPSSDSIPQRQAPHPYQYHPYPRPLLDQHGLQAHGDTSRYAGQHGLNHFPPRPHGPTYRAPSLGLPRSLPGKTTPEQSKIGAGKPSLPEGVEMLDNGSVHCRNCDKNFPELSQYRAHEAHHKQCDIDGCSFMGTHRAVNIHKEEKHAAVSFLVPALETPEQINKWREARRKNFPSANNMKRKAAAQQDRQERGQVARMEVHRHRGGPPVPKENRSSRNTKQNQPAVSQSRPPAQQDTLPRAVDTGTGEPPELWSNAGGEPLPKQRPCADILQSDSGSEMVVVDEVSGDSASVTCSQSSVGGLASLVSYVSDGSDKEAECEIVLEVGKAARKKSQPEEPADVATGTQAASPSSTSVANAKSIEVMDSPGEQLVQLEDGEVQDDAATVPVVVEADGDDDVVEVGKIDESAVMSALLADADRIQQQVNPLGASGSPSSATPAAGGRHKSKARRSRFRRNKNQRNGAADVPPPPGQNGTRAPLLEKLLAPEVRRERNVLLQCIRHIVRQDFFKEAASQHKVGSSSG